MTHSNDPGPLGHDTERDSGHDAVYGSRADVEHGATTSAHRTDEAIEQAADHTADHHHSHAGHDTGADAVHGSRADVEVEVEDTAERVAEAAAAPEDRRSDVFPPPTT